MPDPASLLLLGVMSPARTDHLTDLPYQSTHLVEVETSEVPTTRRVSEHSHLH